MDNITLKIDNFQPWEHVVNISGGKDSAATLLKAVERREAKGRQFIAAFADTGNEHPYTYEFINRLSEHTNTPIRWVKGDFTERLAARRRYVERHWERKGVPAAKIERALQLLQPSGNPFLDLCLWKNRFPSSQVRFCTQELKIIPIQDQVYKPLWEDGKRVISWQGVRAEESIDRSLLPPWQRLEGEGPLFAYRPMLKLKRDEVFAIHRQHGLEPNPLYSRGFSRVGCMPCIMCRKGELRAAATQFPAEIDRLREWERLVGEVSKRDSATFFVNEHIDEKVAWSKTDRGGKQYDMMLAASEAFGTACNQYGTCE